jgi:predicted ATPase/DNA-binding CsgD family transcriptional regulator
VGHPSRRSHRLTLVAERVGSRLDTLRGNLPLELSSFIGRAAELAHLLELRARARLLSLVGPGGVGKTRLALQLAALLRHEFSHGVWLVDLAPLADPALVPQAVADALHIRERAGSPWHLTLPAQLRSRQLLLILDTCERLVESVAELAATLLPACPRLQLVATSREPLGAAGEMVWRVPALSVPEPGAGLADLQLVRDSEAARLFVARASTRAPDFVLTEENAGAVAHICRRLDGLPLALELVAARVASLGLDAIVARLDAQATLRLSGWREAPARQQTLRATLDWSYERLSADERVLLRRLAVFVGGLSLDGVRAVCTDSELPLATVADSLAGLVSRSLVIFDEDATGGRYRLLDTTRQYAADLLEASDEATLVRQRHAEWCLSLTERVPIEALDVAQADRLETEQDNLRAGLRWAWDRHQAVLGLRMAVGAFPFWLYRSHYAEGRAWLERLLALPNAAEVDTVHDIARGCHAQMLLWQGDPLAAEAELEAVLESQRARSNRAVIGMLLVILGNIVLWRGDLGRAMALYNEALDTVGGLGSRLEDLALYQLALLHCELGELEDSRAIAARAADTARLNSRPASLARAKYLQALIAAASGNPTLAMHMLTEALNQQRTIGDPLGVVDSLTASGQVLLSVGQVARALAAFQEAIQQSSAMGERIRMLRAAECLAGSIVRSRPDLTVRLASSLGKARAELGVAAWPRDRRALEASVSAARASLGEAAFAQAWQEGRSLGEGEALSMALSAGLRREASSSELTRREWEVVRLLAAGLSTRQMAETMVISSATVRTHLENVMAKLELHSRAQVIAWAAAASEK